jgi:hypothetical protein
VPGSRPAICSNSTWVRALASAALVLGVRVLPRGWAAVVDVDAVWADTGTPHPFIGPQIRTQRSQKRS